jgi:hypothetical protein
MLIRGIDLTPRQRQLVLNAFVHRWTDENARQTFGGHCPACVQQRQTKGAMAINGVPWHDYHRPLMTDAKWLKEHAFHFIKNGHRLAQRRQAEPAYLADAG